MRKKLREESLDKVFVFILLFINDKKIKCMSKIFFKKNFILLVAVFFLVGGFFIANIAKASPGEIIINEFVSNPSSGNEWVELLNTTDSDIVISNFTLKELTNPDTNPVENVWATLSGTIPAHGILVFEENNLNNTGDSIGLYDNNLFLQQRVTYGTVAGGSYPTTAGLGTEPTSGKSGAYISGAWQTDQNPTKGWFNNAVSYTCPEGVLTAPEGAPVPPTLASIATCISTSPTFITTNMGELTNPSAATDLYFEKSISGSPVGRITFTGPLNLTDSDTVTYLKAIGEKMEAAKPGGGAKIGLNTSTASAFSGISGTVKMYGVTGTVAPNLIVRNNAGTIITSGVDYPVITPGTFDSNAHTYEFTTSHFTSFETEPATVPSNIILAVGSTAAVGGVTNVAIPAAVGTDTTGAVTGWVTSTNDKIKFTVTDAGTATSTITINSGAYASGADYTITSASSLTIVVTTTETGKITGIRTFTVSVTAISADLTNITLSGTPSNYTFSAGTYTYNSVTVANNVSSITVTPTGAGIITMSLDGGTSATLTSDVASDSVALTAGVEKIITIITTETGKSARTYTIKITRALSSAKAITAFSFSSGTGVINETAHTVTVNVSNGIDVTALVATFTTTGAGVAIGATSQVSATTANNFTSAKTYKVTAADGTYTNYVVTVTVLKATQTAPSESGTATVSNSTPEVVITNPDQKADITINSGTDNPKIDVSAFISGGTGTLPEINITSANANNTNVTIPASTVVTSADITWNGVIAAPTITTVTLPPTSGQTLTLSTAIEVGFTGVKLSFGKAVRLLLPGQANKRAGYIRTGIDFTEITNTCTADTQDAGNALGADGDCKINVGLDLVIWTKHFTSFATYTQTTNSGGGGGGHPLPPVTQTPILVGQVLGATTIAGCENRTTGFSVTTGQSCAMNILTGGQVLGAEKFNFTKLMKNGSNGNEVMELQKFLNNNNYVVSSTGFGSPGNETNYFRLKTKVAVIKFQIANGIMNGYGTVGPLTRVLLNKY